MSFRQFSSFCKKVKTWNQIYSMLRNQAEKIRYGGFKLVIIVGITRGKWVPARILSNLLEIPDFATVGVEFYLGVPETRKEPVLTKSIFAVVEGKRTLLVDDVSDTGKSLQLAGEHLRQ